MPSATVHLLRHDQVLNPHRIVYGRMPGYGLTELGVRMAEAAAAELAARAGAGARIVHLVSSPLQRARESAASAGAGAARGCPRAGPRSGWGPR